MTCNVCGGPLRTWNDVERGYCAEGCMGGDGVHLAEQAGEGRAVQDAPAGLKNRSSRGSWDATPAPGDGLTVAAPSAPVEARA